MLIGRRQHHHGHAGGELNVIPLIDVVFFLLVFYVISTSFTRASSVAVEQPSSAHASAVNSTVLTVAVTRGGAVQLGERVVDLRSLPAAVRDGLRDGGGERVLVIADREVATGRLLRVMDACRAGGAKRVEVAAERGSER